MEFCPKLGARRSHRLGIECASVGVLYVHVGMQWASEGTTRGCFPFSTSRDSGGLSHVGKASTTRCRVRCPCHFGSDDK